MWGGEREREREREREEQKGQSVIFLGIIVASQLLGRALAITWCGEEQESSSHCTVSVST